MTAGTPPSTDSPIDPHRLPRAVSPRTYTLTLEPDLAAASFVGTVTIECDLTADVDEVVLNAAELEILSAAVDGRACEHHLDDSTQRLHLHRALRTAARGQGDDRSTATITLGFRGILNDKLRGWYRSTFIDAAGTEQVIATTQMQATDCRRAFPCFDEPDFKATFDITLVVDADLFAVSNGPEISRIADERDPSKVHVRFAPTMPISTYLVAFVVGPLEATREVQVERLGGGTFPLRIIHVPGKAHLTEFGLEIGAFALAWYQRYYGIAYPADKCDMLALPDFAAGAMENLGCVTYRENLLLIDPATATQAEMSRLVDVVAHELAHMWFGDLVTMRWWNGIWLNEAFATFMEVACGDAFRPEWRRWEAFSLERSVAFDVDSLASTRSVEYPVAAPEDAEGMFDVLTYQKGGALLRMLEQYLGEEGFRTGIRGYLERHAHGNTDTADLWDALEAANPETPVRTMMDSWIWQPGYPLVRARLEGGELVLNQSGFTYGTGDDATLFVVPLHLRLDGADSTTLLTTRETRITLPSPSTTAVVNAGGHGFVRVAYDDALRARLVDDLGALSTIERYNLVDDARNEVIAGRMDAAGLLGFLERFDGDDDLAVWRAVAVAAGMLSRLVEGDALVAYRARIARLASAALTRFGSLPVPGEGDLRASCRAVVWSLLGITAADPGAIAEARAIVDGTAPAPALADAELVDAATAIVASAGDDADYERLLALYRSPATPQEMLRSMYALADFPGEAQMRRTIEFAYSDEVKTQNAPFLLARAIGNRHHGALAWAAVRDRWATATARFPQNTIVRMINPVRWLTDPDVVADVQAFFTSHPIPQAAKTLEQVLEAQRHHAALAARERSRFAAALGA